MKVIKSIALVFLLVTLVNQSLAQRGQYRHKTKKKQFYGNQRLQKPLFKWVTGDYSRHGIQLSFGPTYMFTRASAAEESYNLNDTTFEYEREPYGKLGGFVELGMVHITKKPRKYIQYYDWGIGYKQFAGREETRAALYDDRDTLIGNLNGKGDFFNGHLYGRFSVHNVWQINPTTFLDNALGINVDYAITGRNQTYDGYHNPFTQEFQGELRGQLHYDLGFGFKARDGFFIIPGVQLPILGAYEWNGGTPNISWFSSSYYPAQFKLKLVWLFKRDPNRCPPVETNEQDRERAKEYQNQ